MALGDLSGRLSVVRRGHHDKEGYGELFAYHGHWHSMPLAALAWTADGGEHLYTGGGEAVLVKWNAATLEKVGFSHTHTQTALHRLT